MRCLLPVWCFCVYFWRGAGFEISSEEWAVTGHALRLTSKDSLDKTSTELIFMLVQENVMTPRHLEYCKIMRTNQDEMAILS